jgi:hypothetical protein
VDGGSAGAIAWVLDDAWREIQRAWDEGREVEYLMVCPEVLDAVTAAKARETERGARVRLLGLVVVGSTELAAGRLVVC